MTIAPGTAYGERFETSTSDVRLEGDGIRLDSLEIVKASSRASGAAWVGLNGTYSFNLDGRGVPVETISMVTSSATPPLSGRLDFTAGGSGTFERPRYDVRGTISDFFVGDEGIGQVIGELNINADLLTLKMRGGVAPSRGVRRRPDCAHAEHGRRAVVHGGPTRRWIPTCARSTRSFPLSRPRFASGNVRVIGQLAKHRRAAGGGHARSPGSAAVRLPRAQTRRPFASPSTGTPCS